MIVRDIMQTKLVTVKEGDTISHAARLIRHNQIHHLPVVQAILPAKAPHTAYKKPVPTLIIKGLLTTNDIDMAVALAKQEEKDNPLTRAWQERPIAEIMQRAVVSVTPTTAVAAAAQLLVERGINCLPVVEPGQIGTEQRDTLVGIVTRSDILLALARSLGAFEPGTQVTILLPNSGMAPLAKALAIADDLHINICSVLVAPPTPNAPRRASLRLRTINPAPFLMGLEQAGVSYLTGDSAVEG